MKDIVLKIIIILLLISCAIPFFLDLPPWPIANRDYLVSHAKEESGADNIVSAIYLGYRAFDTLGETIILIVAILGTMSILEEMKRLTHNKHIPIHFDFILEKEKRASHYLRTHLLEVVTSKIGPIILIYGFYVMMYGHSSFGGGFQGGVIIASGIIFFYIGNPDSLQLEHTQHSVLITIEAISFFLFLSAAILSTLFHTDFFSNFFPHLGLPKEGFIVLLNSIIGLKVGSGISLMCISMISEKRL